MVGSYVLTHINSIPITFTPIMAGYAGRPWLSERKKILGSTVSWIRDQRTTPSIAGPIHTSHRPCAWLEPSFVPLHHQAHPSNPAQEQRWFRSCGGNRAVRRPASSSCSYKNLIIESRKFVLLAFRYRGSLPCLQPAAHELIEAFQWQKKLRISPVAGLFDRWFLRLLSWLMSFCCEKKILFLDW